MDVLKFRDINVNVYAFNENNELYNAGLCDFDIDDEKVFIITRTKVMVFIPTYFSSSEFFKRKNIIYGITEECKDIIMVFEEEKECSNIFDVILDYSRQNKENGNSGMFAEYPDIIEIRIFLIIIQKIKEYGNRQNFKLILKSVIDAANSGERKKYLAILKKKKLSKLYFNEEVNNECESSSSNNNQQDTNMNNIYDDEDDVIIIVKPEIDVDQENVPSKFAAKTNDVIVLESDTEEEENNETTSKYGGSFSDEESEKDDEGTSYGNNEDDEMSDDDDVVINVKPEIEDVKTVAANNKFRLAKNADEIIVLESDSEESNDSETSQIYHEDKENDDGFNDESLDDDVIVRIKPEIADNDSDEEVEEGSHETSENPVTVNDKKEPVDFPFFQFLKFIKDLNLHNKGKLLKLKGKPDIAKIAATIPELGKHRDFYMSPDFNKNFNALYIAAARRKSIHVDDVTSIINRHLNDGRTVEDFPEFPKAPSHPINMYISEKADGEKNNIYSIAKKRKSFSSGEIDTKPYFDRYLKESKEFIKKAEKYLVEERHRLKESHITHIQNLISKKQKEIEKAEPDSEAGPSCKKRKVKTAFDYYKDANPNLYSEYDAERRDSKLLKKFNRLEDNLKQIYENIAAKNG